MTSHVCLVTRLCPYVFIECRGKVLLSANIKFSKWLEIKKMDGSTNFMWNVGLYVGSTVSSAIKRVSLTRIGYNANDEQENAVCITRTFVYSCWLLRNFSDQCEDITWWRAQFFFWSDYIFITRLSIMRGLTRMLRYNRPDCTIIVMPLNSSVIFTKNKPG